LYFYDVKIQTNIKQNLVKKIREEITNFLKIFFRSGLAPAHSFWAGPDLEQWSTLHCSRRTVESDRRRSKRRELTGQRWWLTVLVAVALSSRWMVVVADDGSSSSLLYFAASFSSVFRLFCQ
jgi:hypothetical protein